jgi:DNA-binding transcriptional MerR regulator
MRAELSIGELSKATGVKVVTIRFYEKTGILAAPARSTGNYRIFRNEHIRRLHFIRRCRDLGFSLDQVRDFLRLSNENTASCAMVCRIAELHLKDVEEKLADLKRLASELRRITASCTGTRPMSECRIIEALSKTERPQRPG